MGGYIIGEPFGSIRTDLRRYEASYYRGSQKRVPNCRKQPHKYPVTAASCAGAETASGSHY